MAGTLSVQKIQGLASSATPTTVEISSGHKLTGAAGSIVAPGHVIQFVQHKWNNQTATTSESYVDVTSSSFNFTPKLATSKLYIKTSCAIAVNRGAAAGYAVFKIVHDGTDVDAPSDRYEIGMNAVGASSMVLYLRAEKSGYVDASNTNARAIKLQTAVNANSNSGQMRFNVNDYFYSYIDVMEIAQ